MPRTLAICVDDFGHHAGVDEAVLQLARRGRISATSCMVGGPSWATGAPALRELDPQALDVGLHLDLTETPLDAALRGGLGRWMARSTLHIAPARALRGEIEAQLDRFEALMGRPPAHVDGHQHVHQFPVVREALLAVLARRYSAARPWLRRTRRVPGQPFGFKAAVIDAMGTEGLARLARRLGFAQNRRMLGVYDFQGGSQRFQALLGQWLAAADTGDLLMCHPARPAAGAGPQALQAAREAEFSVLDGPGFEALLAQADVVVGRMGALLRGR